ncbi:unnamed protein product, partial [Mesorhabditis belari]|uniref:C2H2-type domain-containing protein n=1 Tax=Mesorhabditis belari TaxID=2138241 RepID=A0AAF3ETD6_9BILA
MVRRGWLICLAFTAILFFLLGIFLLLPFPLAVYPALVRSQLHLSRGEDGSFPTLTHYWSKFPADQYYNFYFFNVTNRDEVMYEGAMPSLVEIGPYSYKESEFKEGIDWRENDNRIYYMNNKSFSYQQSTSCDYCTYQDMVTLPNAAYMSVLSLIQANQNLSNIAVNTAILDFLTLILGEAPLRIVPVAGVLFDSYPDPFISLTNSELTKLLAPDGKLLGMQLPPIKYMGYFPKYNHSHDEDYMAYTGKEDVYKTGNIIRWAGNESLAWWGDSYSADLAGATDGSFNKANLKKTDKVKMFQSYACRTFRMTYSKQDSVKGVKAYIYKLENYDYDTTTQLNSGYRYENTELVDYFPTWPCGPNHQYNASASCHAIDCTSSQNWCSNCCNGTHYLDKTVFMPPGMVPLRCLPGQKIRAPFAAFLSPPHFLQSPSEVTTSMKGLAPDPDLHEPAKFYINPMTGSALKAFFRMQLSIPIYHNKHFTLLSNAPNAIMPSFWVNIQVDLKKYAINYIKMVQVIIPGIALGIGIGLIVLTLAGFLISIMIMSRRRRQQGNQKLAISNGNSPAADVVISNRANTEPLSLQPGLLRIQLSFGEKKLSTVLCIDEHGFLPEASLELSSGWRSQCRVDSKLANCDGLKVLMKIECGQEIILSSRNPSRTPSPLNLTDHKAKTLNFSISNLSRFDDEILSESPPEVPIFEDVIAADGKGFECPRCGKVFSYEYYRDKHLKYTRCVDQGDRKFPCTSCSRSFEKRDRLRIHVLHVHENHRPHVCFVCGKAFSQSSSLNKHLRVHSGERPYKCQFCPKAFTASSILRTHIRQHSGEKPFKCAQCGKAFASHAAHDSHVRRTHGELKNDDIF